MQHRLFRLHGFVHSLHQIGFVELAAIVVALAVFVAPAEASTRFQERGLFMTSVTPGATTDYTVSLRHMTPVAVGSIDMLFCIDPIPYHPCVTPPGLDVSGAALSNQTGETGFVIDPSTHTANHIVLTRTPSVITPSITSSYKFDNIVNPTDTSQSFSIRLRSHASIDASGPQIDFGSVKGQVTNGIVIETQVPPHLTFCVAEQVAEDCTSTNDNYYTDMGELTAQSTLTAQSQMAVGTNATAGFSITANGSPPAAGTSVIDSPAAPLASQQGTNQFGINLVANTSPAVGGDPEGPWANAVPSPDYGVPDRYKFVSGDEVAYSPNVSLMKKFTVSYILNSRENLRPGVYTTTITFIASGRF